MLHSIGFLAVPDWPQRGNSLKPALCRVRCDRPHDIRTDVTVLKDLLRFQNQAVSGDAADSMNIQQSPFRAGVFDAYHGSEKPPLARVAIDSLQEHRYSQGQHFLDGELFNR